MRQPSQHRGECMQRCEMAQLISRTATRSNGWGWSPRSRERVCSWRGSQGPGCREPPLRKGVRGLITDPVNTTGGSAFGFLVIAPEFLRISYNSWLWIKSLALPLKYRIKLSNNLLERQQNSLCVMLRNPMNYS